jgi:predicted tellurium resistance membrane protein TerC
LRSIDQGTVDADEIRGAAMLEMFYTSEFWVALVQIIIINIMLSGDNAVVIALACRSLPPKQQQRAIMFGSVGLS